MKKKTLSLMLVLAIILTFIPFISTQAKAITAEEMRTKISELKKTYYEGYTWDQRFAGGIQCWGFAHLCYNYFFGEYLSTAYVRRDVENLCVGDWVRYRPTPTSNYNHSIFITDIIGDTVYYVDCNANGDNKVHWNNTISKSSLQTMMNYTLSGFIDETGTGYIKTQTDNWVKTLSDSVSEPNPIHKDTIAHVRNGYCTIKNVSSGKFMNVYAGIDDNYTSVCMWAYDDSTDQHFRLDHKGDGKYKLYAYCSSRGTNRVVDVCRGTDAPAEGDKIHLWTPDDDTSQLYYIWPVGDNEYVFELASKNGYVIAPNGSGDAASDGAQLTLQRYTGEAHQKWSFCDNNGNMRTTNVNYAPGYYTVNTNGFQIVRRSSPDPYADVLSGYDINDGETFYVSQVNDFWGYTEYNGVGGWVCLDYTKSTVVLDSISILSLPDKTSYFVGDKFDSTGLQITAHYSNGQTDTLTAGFTLSYDLSSSGTKTVSVTYKSKHTSFPINVQNLIVDSISLYSDNIKKEYYVDDVINLEEISILANYNNGSGNIITSGFDVNYDFSTPGTKTVIVSYGGKTTSYEVIVLNNQEEDKATWTVSSATCYSGEEIVVPVILSSDNICDGNITFQYDSSKLEIVDFSLATQLLTRNAYVNTLYDTDKIRVSFAGTGNFIADNEKIISFRFKALDTEGSADIKITDVNLYSSDGLTVDSDITNGTITIIPSVDNVEITNIQSTDANGQKIVTADVSNDNVICYLAAYDNNRLTQCDMQKPLNGRIELCVSGNYDKFILMVWDLNMKPLMNTRFIY